MTFISDQAAPVLERARGRVHLAAARRYDQTVIADLGQAGCGRLLFPKVRTQTLEAVVVNTAGGLTGGDRFEATIVAEAAARLTVTTQACEKIYRAEGVPSRVEARLAVGPQARLAWLPQETILFDRARLVRRLEVDMAGSAELLVVEAVLLGRLASGERMTAGLFRDDWRIRRDGRLVFAEAFRIEGDLASGLALPATLAGAAAFATVLLVAPDAEARLAATRALVTEQAIEGGVSTFDGLCLARLVAQDGASLRSALIPLLEGLGSAVPRVWSL